ncbi:hypothetical protein Y032_0119g830 [Ancylostoma ceylanicum]|uniref:Uncharacterized protein n=1 Tax=Ancylostoma ceylanicum TaxID=53326 RepID=A0A016TB68_9BILA|nr:hypothetical protein Y032_0119g830 [Ancylostoma ceylanicum]
MTLMTQSMDSAPPKSGQITASFACLRGQPTFDRAFDQEPVGSTDAWCIRQFATLQSRRRVGSRCSKCMGRSEVQQHRKPRELYVK